jgi:catechol 2,3-dioxygenase-like lactoylglutathione lyase family enzyme
MNAPPVPIIAGIAQVAISSADPGALVAFYRDVLGLAVLFEAGGMTFLQTGATRLMIHGPLPDQPVGGDATIYFEPRDWSAAEAELEAAGVRFPHKAQVVQRAEGRELVLRGFRDPEGHSLALLGWRAA